MKQKDIEVGKVYTAKVSGKVVRVRVDHIGERSTYRRNSYSGGRTIGTASSYECTNLETGRKLTIRSAQRFRALSADQTPVRLRNQPIYKDKDHQPTREEFAEVKREVLKLGGKMRGIPLKEEDREPTLVGEAFAKKWEERDRLEGMAGRALEEAQEAEDNRREQEAQAHRQALKTRLCQLVDGYGDEAEHQDGYGYWTGYSDTKGEELVEEHVRDFILYLLNGPYDGQLPVILDS